LRLPRLHCYRPDADAPPVGALPALTAGHVTFGSFNKLAKMSADTVILWARVLQTVPGARLFLKSKALAEEEIRRRTTARFVAQGIAADRLTLFGWVPEDAGHLAAYSRIDVGLDTFPYSGTTTTCEALWMGVPVLTLTGATHASRVSASLLSAVGLSEWIAETADSARTPRLTPAMSRTCVNSGAICVAVWKHRPCAMAPAMSPLSRRRIGRSPI
jgi:predicted O-linked N-acetylglucosamine transferase (SPINDLY family)